MRKLSKQKGFTLIEAVVATGLFAITLSSVIGVYLATIKINRRTDLIRTASENARYITEYMSKEIKNGQIAYSGVVSSPCTSALFLTGDSPVLPIVNVDGDRLCFYIGSSSGQVSSSGPDLWVIKNNMQPIKINSSNVKITRMSFYVNPATDPYVAGSTIQPRVTLIGLVQAISGSQDNVTMPVQTSITLPTYDVVAP